MARVLQYEGFSMSAKDEEKVTLWKRVQSFFEKQREAFKQSTEDEKENGWDRIKALFDVSEGPREEIQHIPSVVCYTSAFAFLLGGQFGKRIADDHYRRHNQLTVYQSAMHAQRQYQASVALGFAKYGGRWGWRAGVFSGIYSFLLVACEAYRNKDDALNYLATGASTGVLYNIFSGWRKMLVGVLVGGGLSLPVGLIAQIGSAVLPEEYKPKKVQQQFDNKSEWEQRLEVTSTFIEAMEKELNEDNNSQNDKR